MKGWKKKGGRGEGGKKLLISQIGFDSIIGSCGDSDFEIIGAISSDS